MNILLVAAIAYDYLHARLHPKKVRIFISPEGDAVIAKDHGRGLKGIVHATCRRKMRVIPYDTIGAFGRALVCEKCALRIELPAKVDSVDRLRLRFIQYNF